MCGIAGLVGAGAADHAHRVSAMVAALRHRGPDEDGLAVYSDAVIATARLSIIDPPGGHQPLRGPDGRVAVACNGEIYGHRRLRAQFPAHPFRTGSDCEVVLPLHERHGADLAHHLPGTFALAVWDDRDGTLLLARDRFGERPLYHATTPDGLLLFASESHALFASGLLGDRTPDPEVVAHMLRQGYVPSGRSIWRGVAALPHASRLVRARNGDTAVERWWAAPEPSWDPDPEDAARWFRTELDRAVSEQLDADVPVGALLSGGIDSATVAALASRHHPDLHAFTFDMPGGSELPYAQAVADLHGIALHVCRPDTSRLAEHLLEVARIWDEPFGDSSALPTHLLSGFARERVKVVLTGDGADELLGGYAVWSRHLLAEPEAAQAEPSAAPTRPRLLHRLRARRDGHPPAARQQGSALARRYAGFRQSFDAAELALLGLPAISAEDVPIDGYGHGTVDDIVRFDLDHYLPGDILVKTDRASMAHGLEVRAPFLDVAVAEGCLRLPAHHKVDESQEKLLLRRAARDLWPAAVADRPKQGFGAPMSDWLSAPGVVELQHAHLVDRSSSLFDLVEHAAVQRHLEARDQTTWNLLMLALWWDAARDQAVAG